MAKSAGGLRRQKAVRRGKVAQSQLDRIVARRGGGGGASAGIRPSGRAKRGQGKEFAARRWIANRLDANQRQIARIETRFAGRRGQRKFALSDSKARQKLQVLKKFRSTASAIARSTGDWGFKREIIGSIFGDTRGSLALLG